jgi:hypothetical protein
MQQAIGLPLLTVGVIVGLPLVLWLLSLFVEAAGGTGEGVGIAVTMLFWIGGSLAIYFLPTIIANVRNHTQTMAIVLTNLLLGWTFLGWVAALVWACTSTSTVRSVPAKPTVDPRWQLLRSE